MKPPTRTWKRTLLTLSLFILAGTIINVAVAWGWACTLESLTAHSVLGHEDYFLRSKSIELHSRTLGFKSAGELELSQSHYPGGMAPLWVTPFVNELEYQAMLPWNSSFRGDEPVLRYHTTADLSSVTFAERSTGWPFLSLRSHVVSRTIWDESDVIVEESGIQIPRSPLSNGAVTLPLAPIYPGFAINTIFYTTILWLLFTAPGFVRRRIRIKRGLCPACAYPVGASDVCTECGAPLRIQKP